MCDSCSEPLEARMGVIDADELWRLAQLIEAEMPGGRAAQSDWAIFTGRATGSMGFAALDRLSRSRRSALEQLERRAVATPKRGFRCEAA